MSGGSAMTVALIVASCATVPVTAGRAAAYAAVVLAMPAATAGMRVAVMSVISAVTAANRALVAVRGAGGGGAG